MYGDKVNTFFVANGMSELRFDDPTDVTPFSSMDGSEDGINLEFSSANGFGSKRPRKVISPISNRSRQAGSRIPVRRPVRKKAGTRIGSGLKRAWENSPHKAVGDAIRRATSPEAQARRQANKNRRLAIREGQQMTQQQIAQNLGKTDPTEAMILQQLAQAPATPTPAPSGMSRNMKIGLVIGGLAVATIVAVVVIKKMRTK